MQFIYCQFVVIIESNRFIDWKTTALSSKVKLTGAVKQKSWSDGVKRKCETGERRREVLRIESTIQRYEKTALKILKRLFP